MATPRREELLEELTELFLAEGFLRFGVGELAARLRCSRSTLYQVAASKEQIVQAVVRAYFRRATDRVETRVEAAPGDPATRLTTYLAAVAEELAPASEAFYRDLAAYPPGNAIYQDNTARAARRVQHLVAEGVRPGARSAVDPAFVGSAVAQVMRAIQSGEILATTGLNDAAAYRELADLVVHGLSGPAPGR